jgi:hypothetical protein
MTDDSTVNSQIVDSVTGVLTLAAGQAPSQAFGMLDAVLLETLGMAMHNAVNRQQNASLVGQAAVTAACAKMLGVPFPVPPAPLPPAPPPLAAISPLPSPPPEPAPPAALIASAMAEGEAAIQILKTQAQGSSADAATAQADLQKLAAEAGAPPHGG